MTVVEQLTSPTAIAILVLFGLAFIRFGLWWAVIRLLLAPLLRPAGLLVAAAAAVAIALHLN